MLREEVIFAKTGDITGQVSIEWACWVEAGRFGVVELDVGPSSGEPGICH